MFTYRTNQLKTASAQPTCKYTSIPDKKDNFLQRAPRRLCKVTRAGKKHHFWLILDTVKYKKRLRQF
jgi:hypothetical protein